jgi:hypothetical protein
MALSASKALAQDSSAPNPMQPAAVNAPVPQLAYGVAQIMKLAQAKVSEDTIMAYIKSSGNSYGLNADQIIYLRQQGVSDAVITAMLSQPKAGVATTTILMPTTPAPQPVPSAAYAQTAEPYVETEPTTYYDYEPYYYPVSSYGCWPCPVVLYSGWGGYYGGYRGGWHGGGAWRGGSAWRGGGGWHGSGGVHRGGGGWHGGVTSGGWHGGGSAGGSHGGWHR